MSNSEGCLPQTHGRDGNRSAGWGWRSAGLHEVTRMGTSEVGGEGARHTGAWLGHPGERKRVDKSGKCEGREDASGADLEIQGRVKGS